MSGRSLMIGLIGFSLIFGAVLWYYQTRGWYEPVENLTSIVIDGITHLIYVGAAQGGTANTVLGATGRLDASTTPEMALPEADRTRHIYRG